jgi:hypothetical protein
MSSFDDHYGHGSFTFKEIDKFLWLEDEGQMAPINSDA